MKKSFFLVIFAFTMLTSATLFADLKGTGRLSIAVSFNAMEELTRAVVKDAADISLIIPEGMEPHEAEPTPKNLVFLSNADALIYNGLGMEFYLEKILSSVENKNLELIEASKGIDPIKLKEEEHKHSHEDEDNDAEHEHEDGDHKGHHHHHGSVDPHAWLSPSSAITMVKNIQTELSRIDKKNSAIYKKNADAYIKQLRSLIKGYKGKFAKLKNKHFVASHAAFGYLCRDFGLVQSSIQDVFAEGEPNAKQLAELVEHCKHHGIKTIFSEEAASTALAETLSREVGGKVIKIYTIEIAEDDMDYISRMRENLKRIYENLK